MKRAYTKQLYERIYKQTRIKPDPQVFLGMAARAQTVDTRPFFFHFSSGLGTRLVWYQQIKFLGGFVGAGLVARWGLETFDGEIGWSGMRQGQLDMLPLLGAA